MRLRLSTFVGLASGLHQVRDYTPSRWLFVEIGGPFVGGLVKRALLLGVYMRASDFWELSHLCYIHA